VAVAAAGPYARLHLAPDRLPHQHPTTLFFTGQMPFLPPNQQRQSTEGKVVDNNYGKIVYVQKGPHWILHFLRTQCRRDKRKLLSQKPVQPFQQNST